MFLSASGSGMICVLTSQSFSDGEVVFFLYDQINLTCAKGKKMGFEIPLFAVLSSPAALHSGFHPHGAAAKLRTASREVGQS